MKDSDKRRRDEAKHRERAAKEEKRAANEEKRAAKERERAGKEEKRAAKERERAGKEEKRAAKERERAGKEEKRAAKERERAGKEEKRAAKERERAAKEEKRVAQERERAGKEEKRVAQERERAGKERDSAARERDEAAKMVQMEAHAPGGPRDTYFAEAGEFTPLLAVDCDGARFLVSTADDSVGRSLFVKGVRGEMGTLARAVAVLEQLGQGDRVDGTTFLDLGANIGTSAVTALRSHRFGRAVACEPSLENYRLLLANAAINKVGDCLRALPVAVSDENGSATLVVHGQNSGGHHIAAGDLNGGGDRTTVDTLTVDHLIETGILKVDEMGLIWIDAQGHEGHIVRGASALVGAGTPIVLEFYPSMLESAGGLAPLIETIRQNYSHFVDLRQIRLRQPPVIPLHPSAGLSTFAQRFSKDGPHGRFTDILALRVDSDTDQVRHFLTPVDAG